MLRSQVSHLILHIAYVADHHHCCTKFLFDLTLICNFVVSPKLTYRIIQKTCWSEFFSSFHWLKTWKKLLYSGCIVLHCCWPAQRWERQGGELTQSASLLRSRSHVNLIYGNTNMQYLPESIISPNDTLSDHGGSITGAQSLSDLL